MLFKVIIFYIMYCIKCDIYYTRFKVCGSYCGPGWCNNMWLDEDKCNTTIEPEYHNSSGYSCEDLCCKHHDKCCSVDKSLQKDCNNKIVNCLSKCDVFSLTCTNDYIPVAPFEVKIVMNIIDSWCCGTPCPKTF